MVTLCIHEVQHWQNKPTCALPDGHALRQFAHITQSLLSTCLQQQQPQQQQQQQQG
jgi:hypothetical protein